MAATVSAWAKPGAWALDSEEHDAQQKEIADKQISSGNGDKVSDFPSLAIAAAAPKSKKKTKGQTLSLQEFSTYSSVSKGPSHNELLALPTGPRQRSAEEIESQKQIGGGFRNYGERPGRGGFSDEQPRRPRDSSRDGAPSRADEVDDWGAEKKSMIGNGFERRDRGERGERGGFFPDSKSRADEVDNWTTNKTFVPSDNRRRGGGFESNGSGGAADSDNWVKRKEEEGRRFGTSGGSFDSLREKRGGGFESSNGGGMDSDTWNKRAEEGSGRPRLNLQPRTLPVGEGIPQNGTAAKPKGSNPFGDARPREEVLKSKGQDPKEVEEKLEPAKLKEAAGVDGPPGKRGFGGGSWRGSLTGEKTERAWRKPETLDVSSPSSVGKTEEPLEAAEDGDAQI